MNMQIGIFYHFGPENGLKGIVEYMGRSSFNGISLEITSTVIHLEFLEFLESIVCLCMFIGIFLTGRLYNQFFYGIVLLYHRTCLLELSWGF